jgi:hypothetical protein
MEALQTFLVYTRPVTQGKTRINQELKREKVDGGLLNNLEGSRDYIVNAEGNLYKVIEKVADLREGELRILLRAA